MSLAVAIQMDPIDNIDIDADSTFVLALEAAARGHALFHYLPSDLAFRDGRLFARARPLAVRREQGNHFTLGAAEKIDLRRAGPTRERPGAAAVGEPGRRPLQPNSGSTCLPIRSMVCITLSWGIL